MTSSSPQVPPRPAGASQIVTTGPPSRLMRLSLSWAKNARDVLSGEKKKFRAPSVPSSAIEAD